MADTKISALTAASTLDGTEVYPADVAGTTSKVTGNQIQTYVRIAGNTSAGSWPILGSGTVLSSPVAGAEEYDGVVRYFTPATSSRGVDLCEYFCCLSAAYTFPSSTTNPQQLFNASVNGTLTIPAGTYWFEVLASLSSMSSTSGNLKFDVLGAGNATLGTVHYHVMGIDGATGTAGSQTGCSSTTVGSPASAVTAGTATTMQLTVRGCFRCTAGGTIIPSVALVTAAQAVVATGSYFRCRPVGSATVQSQGNWG